MFLRSRKKFPTADLRPVGGELTGAIAYNSMTNK
jgi:hypothetical protein